MPGMTSRSLETAARDAEEVSFAGDAEAHASAEPTRTTLAAVARPEGTRRTVEIIMWVK
jgi:hypothetical protein